jgi:pimeloyl-ACP methyl ester carboxylesterase
LQARSAGERAEIGTREIDKMAPTQHRHHVRDIDVRLFRAGAGRPLVFLHGAGGVPPWNAFFEKLAGRYDVFVPEHPGFGTLDNANEIKNVADLAMYYLDFLDALDTPAVHLVGHSLGGWTAAEIAVRNCSRLASLSLIAPAGIRVKGIPCGDNFIWSPEETARHLFHDQKLAEVMLSAMPSEEETDRQLANRFMAARLGWDPRWFNPALERWLHRIKLPSLLLWGADDKLLPSAYAKRWQELVPGLGADLIAECGHLPHVEKADATAGKILRFLEGK